MILKDREYFVKELQIPYIVDDVVTVKETINIGVRNKLTGAVCPSPLTDFIIKQGYESTGKLNTAKAPAYVLVAFLNYMIDKISNGNPDFIDIEKAGIEGFNLQHASSFITHQALVKENKISTINQYERYLSDFYVFLNEQGLNNNYKVLEELRHTRYGSKKVKCVDFGKAPTPPTKENNIAPKMIYKKLKDFGENRIMMAIEFILIAKRMYPASALGFYFMFFGGLRCGEVVNTTKNALEYKKGLKCTVSIYKRTKQLFSHIKDNRYNQPKKPRNQSVFITPLLDELVNHHKKFHSKHSTALFTNRNGNPLTGKSLAEQFSKVKKVYEKELSLNISRRHDYDFIKFVSWRSHIGRGVFTNICLQMGMPLTEVSIARGDSSGESLMAYIEELNAQAALLEASEKIDEEYQKYKMYREMLKKEKLDDEEIRVKAAEGVAKIEPEHIVTFRELYTKVL